AAPVDEAIGLPERGARAVACGLRDDHGLATLITQGARGAIAVPPQGAWHIGSLAIEPVDTVGAGDAFCGTLAAALDNGMTLPDALRAASVAGALACLAHGAMPSLPDAEAIDARLGELDPAEAVNV